MNDSDSSSDEEGAYMSAAGELSLSPSPHNYETPLNSEISGDSEEERGEVKGATENDPEESLEDKSDEDPATAPSDLGGDGGEVESVQPARSCQSDATQAADNPDVNEDSGAEQTEMVTAVEEVKKKKKEGQVTMRESTSTPTQVTVLQCNVIDILKNCKSSILIMNTPRCLRQ